MLSGPGRSSRQIFHALNKHVWIERVVMEEKVSKKKLIKRRIQKLGLFQVMGQVLFQLSVPVILSKLSQKRIQEITSVFELNHGSIDESKVHRVTSINSEDCMAFLKEQNPDLVLVNGTRIISSKVLDSTTALFINTHAGITPQYRGVHGGYWALANDDAANCGVTVHQVDQGIDTGGVLFQKSIRITSKDNFVTYPYIQTGEGIELLLKAIADFSKGTLIQQPTHQSNSRLWHHPTLWFYLWKRVTKGVK